MNLTIHKNKHRCSILIEQKVYKQVFWHFGKNTLSKSWENRSSMFSLFRWRDLYNVLQITTAWNNMIKQTAIHKMR